MRILFVAQRYHPFVGGVETQTRLVVHELARREHEVRVVATTLREPHLPARLRVLGDSLLLPDGRSYDDEGVPVHVLTPGLGDRLRMLPIALRTVPLLARRYHALRRFGYPFFRRVFAQKLHPFVAWADVVHSVAGNYLGWTAQEVARALGRPFVVTPYVHPGQYGDGPTTLATGRRPTPCWRCWKPTERCLSSDWAYRPKRYICTAWCRFFPIGPMGPASGHGMVWARRRSCCLWGA